MSNGIVDAAGKEPDEVLIVKLSIRKGKGLTADIGVTPPEVLWFIEQFKLQLMMKPAEEKKVVEAGGAIIPGLRG